MKLNKFKIVKEIIIATFLLLCCFSAGIYIVDYNVKDVNLCYLGEEKKVRTLAKDVKSFLESNKINNFNGIDINLNLEDKLYDNINIEINPNKNISLDNLNNVFDDCEFKIIEQKEIIKFKEQKINNNLIAFGSSKIRNYGKNGEKLNKYLIKYKNGKEISRENIEESIVKQPVDKIIEVGTNLALSVSRNEAIINLNVDKNFRKYNIKLPVNQQKYTYNMCKQYGVEYELFLALMYKESRYRPNAIGGGNSYGLSQIHISNFKNLRKRLGVSNFLDPYDNIKSGVYMFSIYLNSARKKFKDKMSIEVYALNSYNMGEGVYYNKCYSKGIFHREYSTSIRKLRDNLIKNGTI